MPRLSQWLEDGIEEPPDGEAPDRDGLGTAIRSTAVVRRCTACSIRSSRSCTSSNLCALHQLSKLSASHPRYQEAQGLLCHAEKTIHVQSRLIVFSLESLGIRASRLPDLTIVAFGLLSSAPNLMYISLVGNMLPKQTRSMIRLDGSCDGPFSPGTRHMPGSWHATAPLVATVPL